jgi:hypothetical protein
MQKVRPGIEVPLVVTMAAAMIACGGQANDPRTPQEVNQQPVTITISPTTASLTASQQQQFKAVVDGTTNTSVTWSVDGTIGGNSSLGVITANGAYTAPGSPGKHTITVASVADPSKTAKASVSVSQAPVTGMLTERNDLARTGQNLSETTLTTSNVNSSTFGKLASYPVDGYIYAQPLYVSHLAIGGGTHDVVFVATEHDTVYAFDAEGKSSTPYWHRSFIDPSDGITTVPTDDVDSTIFSEIGITGTPVIDPTTNTMYFVVYTKENGKYVHRLHAIDITTGQDKFGGAVDIKGTVPGNSDWGSDGNGNVVFDSKSHLQRPGLLLLNGIVYVAFGSHGDNNQYHGWIMAYKASTLQQVAVWNSTADGHAGAIWSGGTALSADSSGNIYVVTANGDFGLGFGPNASDSVLRLTYDPSVTDPTKAIRVADYFTPDNQEMLASDDNDLGSSGLMLIPGTHLGTVAGKEGSIYLVDLNNLGHFNATDNSNIPQFLPGVLGDRANGGTDENFSTATYFNGNVYYIGEHDNVRQFALSGGQLSTKPISISNDVYDKLGAQAAISANGSSEGILWAIEYVSGGGNGELRAYDATDVSKELYTSSQAGGRDGFGRAVKFSVPTIFAGKVYVGGQDELAIFGNL